MYSQYMSAASSSTKTVGLMDRHLHQRDGAKTRVKKKQAKGKAFVKKVCLCRTDKGNVIAVPRYGMEQLLDTSLQSAGRTIYDLAAAGSVATKPDEVLYFAENALLAFLEQTGREWEIYNGTEEFSLSGGKSMQIADLCTALEDARWTPGAVSIACDESHWNPQSGRSTPGLYWSSSSSVASVDEAEPDDMHLDAIFHEFIDIKQCEGFEIEGQQ